MSDTRVMLGDLLGIVNYDSEAGYHGVYPRRSGNWQAKPAKGVSMSSRHPTPRHAAIQVVRWWKDTYGAEWLAYFQARRTVPYILRKESIEPGFETWDETGLSCPAMGYRLMVYIRGVLKCVPPPDEGEDAVMFTTRKAAIRYFHRWAKETYGDAARFHVTAAKVREVPAVVPFRVC
jgi:hypothetical protein